MTYAYDERLDGPLRDHDKAAIVRDLQALLPDLPAAARKGRPAAVRMRRPLRLPHHADAGRAARHRRSGPGAARSTPSAQGVPVVARGAGTGLSGGALPLEKGILLVMARFNRILDLDPEACTARVQPGVRNLAISQAAAPHGLYYAPDPSSQIACSIGGNVAENAGGVHCLKYGLTVHNILKVEIADDRRRAPHARLRSARRARLRPARALHRLGRHARRRHRSHRQAAAEAAEREGAARELRRRRARPATRSRRSSRAGVIPGGLEMMDNLAIRAAEDFIHAGYPVDAEAILLCEVDGAEVGRAGRLRARRSAAARGGRDRNPSRAETKPNASASGPGRKNAFPAVGRISPDYYCMDGTIPRRELPRVLKGIAELSDAIRAAGRQRVPCRRRQHAPADPLRCQRARRNGSRRSDRRAHPRTVRRGRRQHHGRARRGPREDQPDVRAIQQRRADVLPRA